MRFDDMRYKDLQSRKIISFSSPRCKTYRGWAEYYFKRIAISSTPVQAEHLMWWYLLLEVSE